MNGSLSDPLESLKAAGQRQRNAAFNQPLTQNGNGNTNGHQQVFFFYPAMFSFSLGVLFQYLFFFSSNQKCVRGYPKSKVI